MAWKLHSYLYLMLDHLEPDYTTRHIDTRKLMKLPKSILLIAFNWLAMSPMTVQASYFDCPIVDGCSYAANTVSSTGTVSPTENVTDAARNGDITDPGFIGNITGAAFDPDQRLILAQAGSDPDSNSIITAVLTDPIYQSLWIVTDWLTSPAEPDERMEVLYKLANDEDDDPFASLGIFFAYNANDPDAIIDLEGIATILNPVIQVQIKGVRADTSFACVAAGGDGCTTFDNSVGVLGVAGITASTVPVPATVWLFGSGLIGLLGIARRRRK